MTSAASAQPSGTAGRGPRGGHTAACCFARGGAAAAASHPSPGIGLARPSSKRQYRAGHLEAAGARGTIRLIYWSHSYRPEDQQVNRFFTRLFDREDLRVSFDPPSGNVNAAKLQRHLNGCDAMVSVLTRRDEGVSPYILFEIDLCIRSRKPLVVFIEDVLLDPAIPGRVLQRRFSRHGFLRQVREHRNALQILSTYLGNEPPPRYQPDIGRRSCVIAGDDVLPAEIRARLCSLLEDRGYRPILSSGLDPTRTEMLDAVTESQAALAFIDAPSAAAQYTRGLLRGASVPTIELTTNPAYAYSAAVPSEFQPIPVAAMEWTYVQSLVEPHLDLTEQDFVFGDGQDLETYLDLLLGVGDAHGHYRNEDREKVVKVVMGDEYTVGQAGAVGPGSQAENMTFVQTWNQLSGEQDTSALAADLSKLRAHLRATATDPEHDAAIGVLAEAEMAANENDGPKALERISVLNRLGSAGKWALDAATSIGTAVAAAAIKAGVGL